MTQRPFDDIRALIADLPAADPAASAGPRTPLGAASGLGQLAELVDWIVAWRGRPAIDRPVIALYAGPHAGDAEVGRTRDLMEAIAAGNASVSRAAHHLGAGLDVFDLAIDRPVGDRALGPTMSERECAATMAFGMEVLAKQPDLLVLGALGEGAPAAAAAIAAALVETTTPDGDPLDLLRALGGRETAAIVGAILAARTQRVPVLLEGRAAVAAAAVLHAIDPSVIAHCQVGSMAPDAGGEALLARMDRVPLVALDLTLEDGTGSAAALSLVKLACALSVEGVA